MQTFKIFEEREPSALEGAVNSWANTHNLKIIDFKYGHTTKANGSPSYSAGVLFEPMDPSAATAAEVQLNRETNEMLGRKMVEKGGVTVIIRGRTGSGKTIISDMLGKLAYDYGISYEHECQHHVGDMYNETAEMVKLGVKGYRK